MAKEEKKMGGCATLIFVVGLIITVVGVVGMLLIYGC